MSFWPSIYDKISNQIKLVEYRRNFPKECKYAYMYVSSPIKSVCGIIYFGNKHSLKDWENQYENNQEISNRIRHYSESYRFGMEISGFQKIIPITLTELRENVPDFVAPQSYFLFKNNPTLEKYILDHTIKVGPKITNNLESIFPEHICKEY